MSEDESAARSGAERELADLHARDPYAAAPTHDPAFPSWRYAGLRWFADRLYSSGRPRD